MKIAFCFMSYGDVEQKKCWTQFFDGVSSDLYSVFLHRTDKITQSWVPTCTIIPTQPTAWGSFSLLKVQQNLLNEAYKDSLVTKFVLLSGDSIPIISFKELYTRLMGDDKGSLEYEQCITVNHASREKTVNRTAWPQDMPWVWRLASQWMSFNRFHVQKLQDNWTMLEQVFKDSVIPDEHMYVVFFSGINMLDTFNCTNLVYINWYSRSIKCKRRHRARPKTYHTHELSNIDTIQNKGYCFMRKICPLVQVNIAWTV